MDNVAGMQKRHGAQHLADDIRHLQWHVGDATVQVTATAQLHHYFEMMLANCSLFKRFQNVDNIFMIQRLRV
jgi:hypothetical protein